MHLNDRELQKLCVEELSTLGVPTPERCIIQIQWKGLDLVCRIRFSQLAAWRPGTFLHPTAEWRYEDAREQPRVRLREYIREFCIASLMVVREEVLKRKLTWPSGWPVVKYADGAYVLNLPASARSPN